MSDGNCITDATTRSIIAAATSGKQGGGGDSGSSGGAGTGGSSGGGNGNGSSGGDAAAAGGGAPHPMRIWTFVFAGMLAAGGTAAYVRKGSVKSLGASLSAGVILALCARSMVGAPAIGAVRVAFGEIAMAGLAGAGGKAPLLWLVSEGTGEDPSCSIGWRILSLCVKGGGRLKQDLCRCLMSPPDAFSPLLGCCRHHPCWEGNSTLCLLC